MEDQNITTMNEEEGPASYEEKASWFSKILFMWLNPLLEKGYKKALNQEDLPQLSTCDRADVIYDQLSADWNRHVAEKPSLFKSMARTFGLPFCLAALLKLIHDICQFVGPVMLDKMLNFLKDESVDPSKGYQYALIMFVAALFQSLCLRNYFYLCFRTGMRLRSSCVTMVYNKALRLSVASRARYTEGEIMNLMEVDSQKIQDITSYLQTIWSGPFQIIVSLVLLWRQLGPATLAGVAVMLLMIPMTRFISKKLAAIQRELMKVKDRRINTTSEALEGMKLIKLQSWEKSFLQRISGLRCDELAVLRRYVWMQTFSQCMWNTTPYLVSTLTFLLYVLLGNPLTASAAFVSLSLFNILRFPLTRFPETINSVAECQVSVQRVQRFLLAEEIEVPERASREQVGISIQNGDFFWSEASVKKEEKKKRNRGCFGKKAEKVIPTEEEEKAEPFLLSGINISFDAGQLTAVVGHVGCGKSSLLNAILGEMPRVDTARSVSDVVRIRGSIGYVPQTPFIMNASLRDNILFGSAFDADKYEVKVLEACCLKPDIAVLPAGDATEIGEKGINLSGGQKTRVSLARAVYQNCDIYLLDDPLSAVDAHVGKHIFRECVRGLLKNKCVVLVTHALEYLPVCDRVIVLEKGRVEDAGDFAAVSGKKEGVLAGLLAAQKEAKEKEGGDETPSDETPGVELSPLAEETEKKEEAKEKGKLITKEARVEGQVHRSVYSLYFASAGGACAVATVLLLFVLAEVSRVTNNWWLTFWSNDSAGKPGLWYVGVYALIALCSVLLLGVRYITLYLSGVRASAALHDKLLRGILRSPMSFFDQTPLGRITNRVSKDIYTVDKTLPGVFASFLSSLFSVVATLVVITMSSVWFLVVVFVLFFYYVYEGRFYVRSTREMKRLDSISRSPIYANFGETLDGTPVIRAYQKQAQFVAKNYALLDRNQRAYFLISGSNCWLGIRLEFAGTVIIGATALLAVLGKDPANVLFTSMAGLAMSYSLDVTQSLNWLVRQVTDMETQIVAVERIQEYAELPSEAPAHIAATAPSEAWPAQGDVVIEDLTMRYRPELEPVLKHISLHITPGEKVGVVGRTGAGKSSLVLCLMRIVELETGRIVIDGVDISKIGLEDLRSKMAIIPQEPLLFSGTVRDNLDPFKQYTDEEIWSSLERARMRQTVAENPAGLEAVVEEHGSNFSVGQRQLLCVARALLRKSKVILMDEATASIDVETDLTIQKTIRSEFKDSTVITIAHRIHTISDSDKVLVLDLGEVKEFDAPSVLLSDKNSLYSQLVEKSKEVE